jgi:tRNA(Arg) A34 adenosine deaminase TadA
MCSGTLYWSNIGRLVYAASEEKLKEVTGEENPENFTMSLPCRDVLKHGQKEIQIWGPIEDVEKEVIEDSERYWKPVRENLGLN